MGFLDKAREWDKEFTDRIEEYERPYLSQCFEAITSLGSPQLSIIYILALAVLGSLDQMVIFCGAVVLSWAVVFPAKILIGRERPEDNTDSFLISQSFPSGHTGTAFAAATALTYLHGSGLFFFSLAGLVGFSRVYLDNHFFADVLAGMISGILAAVLFLVSTGFMP
jgi:undecaprenyl-diphosphatase